MLETRTQNINFVFEYETCLVLCLQNKNIFLVNGQKLYIFCVMTPYDEGNEYLPLPKG